MTATLPLSTASPKEIHEAFAEEVAKLYDDPLRYVLTMYHWGTAECPGTGPDTWQTQALIDIGKLVKERKFDGHTPVAPIRFTRSSGHDVGKTTMAAWISCWIKDTRPDSIGTVTANTFTQLETKTWAAIQKWTKLALTRDWWEVGATKIYNKLQPDKRETWFVACQSSSEENSEAFAGQHSKFSTSYYILDEASSIPDEIWRVAEGGLTDGEPMIFAFGNPTKNTGMFYEANFGNKRHRWNHGSIDSRTSGISNKETIEEWRQDYGEESDFFRVRVRGLAPMASEDQLIPRDLIEGAQGRQVSVLDDEPLIAGVDVPFGGAAWFVIRFRRGLDGRSVPPIRVAGSKIERPEMITRCAALLSERDPKKRIAMMFFDTAYGAPIVERLRSLGFDNVMEVNFGSVKTPDDRFYNMRSFMWAKQLKEWLGRGAIDKNDTKLMIDMMAPGFHLNNRNQFVLESKESMTKRGIAPVDDGDALALTFAQPVAPVYVPAPEPLQQAVSENAWMG